MKIVFLLALTSSLSGLASCRSILPGGDQAKNIELEYTYIDEFGKPIKVKVQSDLIDLSGIQEVEETETLPSFFKIAADSRKPDIEFKPSVRTIYVTAPAPEQQVQYVLQPPVTKTFQLQAPEPEVRYVLQHGVPKAVRIDTQETEMQFVVENPVPRAIEVKQPEVHTIYVQAPASSVPVSTVEVKAPEPEIVYVTAPEPQAIRLDIDIKEPEDSHFLVTPSLKNLIEVKAPEPEVVYVAAQEPQTIELDIDIKEPEDSHIHVTPSVKRTLEIKTPEPNMKHVIPAHFIAPTHKPKPLNIAHKKDAEESKDEEDFGSAEK